jgi:hypothetical protein
MEPQQQQQQSKKVSLVNYYYYVLAPLGVILFFFFIFVLFRLRPFQVTSATVLGGTMGRLRDGGSAMSRNAF